MTVFRMFAVSPPGLEGFTLRELEELGTQGKAETGGVEFKGSLELLYRSNLMLRTANRVLVRVATFRATSFRELVERVKRYPWEIYISSEVPLRLRVTSKASRLYHTGAIAERVLEGMKERLGFAPSTTNSEDEGEAIIVRVVRDRFTISVNSSGAMLYKRGYKKLVGKAPLRETFAAAMLMASGWDRKTPLIDPFCGSGTICTEAALFCTCTPPGILRGFAFERWKIHDQNLWHRIKEEAKGRISPCTAPILGFDISEKALELAEKNAASAGVAQYISLKRESFPKTGLETAYIVTNPPYGLRVFVPDVEKIYRKLGERTKRSFREATVCLLAPDKRLASATGIPLERLTSFSNGGIRVGLYVGKWVRE